MKTHKITLFCAASLLAAGIAQAGDYRSQAIALIKQDFHPRGIATADRVYEDGLQAVCNRSNDKPPAAIAERLQKDQFDAIKWPSDGKYMGGDWKSGEKIAQSGRGMAWNYKPDNVNGGSCYNCHQIGPKETSFGTLGPSLYQFGKVRGYGEDMQKYVWGKIYNAKATNLCSQMPRLGHSGTLTEKQIKDLVALLLDPNSPVNKE
ncbi:MAG: sulfur oxidation c-type cytochrome SoxX [Rhodocyclaceae bacterium]|jgi:sulfur-oxidizing protein SoxX|nr:sulfur oxidation c-type cytochrome SoxX [Rhodocyclaceae bacterium]